MGVPLPHCVAYGSRAADANQQPAFGVVQLDSPGGCCDTVSEAMITGWFLGPFGGL